LNYKNYKKYWYVVPLFLLFLYLYPRNYLKNCVNDFNDKQTYYNKKFSEQYGLITCAKIKKEDLNTFNLLKGRVFSKTTAFKKYLPR
jgi:hypothetical protein